MIDLRLAEQSYRDCYIWKRSKNTFEIGKNGTSFHTKLITTTNPKQEIMDCINENIALGI